jgi:predicted regulator of Ras-like GTPase activity (Roadblock/LC7/MglB family)
MQKELFVDSLAAMSAIILGAAEKETDYGRLVVIGAGPKVLLILLAGQDTGLGLILPELEKSAKKLKEILA